MFILSLCIYVPGVTRYPQALVAVRFCYVVIKNAGKTDESSGTETMMLALKNIINRDLRQYIAGINTLNGQVMSMGTSNLRAFEFRARTIAVRR